MKSLTDTELDLLIAPLKELSGARLQKVFFSGDQKFAFEFYLAKPHYWIVDLTPTSPLAFVSDQLVLKTSKKTAPLQLFIKAHFVGKRLEGVERDNEQGRVLRVFFAGGGEWEIKLYPHGQNFSARFEGKSIFFQKPKPETVRPQVRSAPRPPRTSEQILEEWRESRLPTAAKKQSAPNTLKAWLEKREQLRAKLTAQLAQVQPEVWRKSGEVIKANPSAPLPDAVREKLADYESHPERVEACFAEEKKLVRKKERLEKRLKELEDEIQNPPSPRALTAAPALKKTDGSRTHFKTFHHGDYTLWVGRSAADNLKILRSAKPWYLWMHAKDEPGAHGIVRLNRGQKISPRDLQLLGENFLRLSLAPAAFRRWSGTGVEIILAEVRHVRPIKGDRLGRVRYGESKTLTVQLS